MNYPPEQISVDETDSGFVHHFGPSVQFNRQTEEEAEGEEQDVSNNDVSDRPARKKRRILRACDQCRPNHNKCSGYVPCRTCFLKKKKCTYKKPVRGVRDLPQPPPAPPEDLVEPRNVAAPRLDENGQEAPCNNCFSNGIECTYPESRQHSDDSPEDIEAPIEAYKSRMRRAYSPDPESLQLTSRYPDDPTPLLVFLHRAWQRLARAYYPPSPPQPPQPNQRNNAPVDPKIAELAMSRDDQPFDRTGHLQFPPRATWFLLQNSFFNSWMSTFHFLHRFTASTWLDIVEKNASAGVQLWHGIGHGRCAIALMTMALGTFEGVVSEARPSPAGTGIDVPIDGLLGDKLFSLALSISDLAPAPPKLDVIQATLLQDIYLICTCRINQAYYSFANTLKMITSQGLHRQLGRNRGLGRDVKRFPDYPKIQCERRTFWSAYVIDKQLSLMFGQPSQFNDDTVDQLLPDCINDEDMRREGPVRSIKSDCYLAALVGHAELGKLIDKIMREVYTLGARSDEDRLASAVLLSKQVEASKLCIPTHLSVFHPTSMLPIFRRQSTLLRIAHYHALILAHRPFLLYPFPKERGDRKAAHDRHVKDCVEAAVSAIHAINAIACGRDGLQFQTLIYVHKVAFVAATALLVIPVTRAHQRASPGPKRTYEATDKRSRELVDTVISFLVQGANPHATSRRFAIILEEMKAESIRHTPTRIEESEDEEEDDPQDQPTPADYYSFFPPNDGESGSESGESGRPSGNTQWEFVEEQPDTFDQAVRDARRGKQPSPPIQPPELTLWEDWQITDWVDLDSAAFGPISSFAAYGQTW